MWGYDIAPGMYAVIRIRCVDIRDQKNGPSCNTEGIAKIPVSHRVVDQLPPHHDSQFSAFSTEVLIRFRPGHNHSSSPFTTLADRPERRVASTGVGQPNY